MRLQIPLRRIDGRGIVDGHDFRAERQRNLREASRAAAGIENELAAEGLLVPPGLSQESLARDRQAGVRVELRGGEAVPLKAEITGVVLRRNEAGDGIDDRIRARALRAGQRIVSR